MDTTNDGLKRSAENRAEELISSVDETDRWAMSSLAFALGAIAVGWYHLARAELDLAVTPQNQRSPDAVMPVQHASITRKDLEDALAYVRGMPSRPY